jgi:hypothetical protein
MTDSESAYVLRPSGPTSNAAVVTLVRDPLPGTLMESALAQYRTALWGSAAAGLYRRLCVRIFVGFWYRGWGYAAGVRVTV